MENWYVNMWCFQMGEAEAAVSGRNLWGELHTEEEHKRWPHHSGRKKKTGQEDALNNMAALCELLSRGHCVWKDERERGREGGRERVRVGQKRGEKEVGERAAGREIGRDGSTRHTCFSLILMLQGFLFYYWSERSRERGSRGGRVEGSSIWQGAECLATHP